MRETNCLNIDDLRIYHNTDGTMKAFTISPSTGEYIPYQLTKPCCENIGGNFDIVTQRCFKGDITHGCNYNETLNLVLNPVGNSFTIFSGVINETCTLEVQFDYLFKFDCNKLSDFVKGNTTSECTRLDSIFENIGASMSIQKITPSQYGAVTTSVYTEEFFTPIGAGNLLDYLQNNSGETGFYVCIDSEQDGGCNDLDFNDSVFLPRSDCFEFAEQMLLNHPTVPNNSFGSNWLTFNTEITDSTILSAITNENIKLAIKLSGYCIDMCVLVDNIRLNKKCTKALRDDIFVTKSPGFELDRTIDNKKSWVKVTENTHREYVVSKSDGTNRIRQTDYYLDDERQVLNTKEIDLDIDIASAIETDIWCYISDNNCILTGVTIGTTTCVKDVFQYTTGTTITTTTGLTNVVVYTACTITATSSTTITYPATTAYTCPVGYLPTPANDGCEAIIIQPATLTNLGPTIPNGDKSGVDYGIYGTYFYPTISNISSGNNTLPYRYDTNNNLVDGIGNVIQPMIINDTNPFWASLGSDSNGRLNNIGILPPDDNWAGFTQCIDIVSGGTYYIGIAADNQARFFINDVLVVNFNANLVSNFRKWSVFPVQFNSGVNIIRMEGLNSGSRGRSNPAAFAAEVYYPLDFNILYNASGTGSTEANAIFSTVQKVGDRFDVGDDVGYSCPANFVFSNCDTPRCIRVLKEPINIKIKPSSSVISATTYTAETMCPTLSSITVTQTATTITAGTICLPKTYCCSEYCGDANIDIQRLFTNPLSGVTTIEDFKYYTTSQLIDVKNRQTITSYATLRLLYDRYMNSLSFCDTQSAKFDYFKMDQFANLVGNYWVDLIEQVVPATTIWGSTRIYTNTMFDGQKHKYKGYTTQFGTPNFKEVLSTATGATCGVDAITTIISGDTSTLPQFNEQNYSTVYVTQMNSSPEFIGRVNVNDGSGTISDSGENIENCYLEVTIQNDIESNGTLTAVPSNYVGEVIYNWVTPTFDTNVKTVPVTTNGLYTIIVYNGNCTAQAVIEVNSL